MDHPFWHIAASAHDRVVYNFALRHLSERCRLSSFQACYFWLRVSSPQLAAASALGPVMWGPFSADAPSIDALPAVIIPYVIIMTESDPIKVLMYGAVCPSHICCVRSAEDVTGCGDIRLLIHRT